MIKFIGSKRALLPWILAVVDTVDRAAGVRRVLDPFSGTARVGHALKRAGYQVTAGDVTAYAHVIATALVEADARDYPESLLRPVLEELGRADGPEGYFTRTFCREARYFHPDNGRRIEAVRRAIPGAAGGDRVLEAILLALCDQLGPDEVRRRVRPLVGSDKVVQVCFSAGNPDPGEALGSYYRDLAIDLAPLVLWNPREGGGT